ncbi:MAG: hypothetical protein SOV38_04410 [Prevotella sp.]|nr:hypothetical protein [Prevotella sp.]
MLNSCLEPTVTDQREVMAVPRIRQSTSQGTVLQTVLPMRLTPGLCPGLRPHYLPTVSGSKDKSRLVQPYRLVFNCFAKPEMVYFHVYRLEEDGSVQKEGGVRLTV